MANLAYRRNSIQRTLGSVLAPGASYTVTAYPAGAQVSGNQSGTTITVRSGHGIPNGGVDVCVVRPGVSPSIVAGTFQALSSSTATTVTFPSSVTVVDGDLVVNLGADTGTTNPAFDGSTAAIYSDVAGGSAISQSRVTANSSGEYEYFTKLGAVWEIVRAAGASAGAISDLVVNAVGGSVNAGGPSYQVILSENDLPGPVSTNAAGTRGVFINRVTSTGESAHGVQLARDGVVTWSIGEDYRDADDGSAYTNQSYFAIWGSKANTSGGNWTGQDAFGISWGGADTGRVTPAGVDGPKWRFNGAFSGATEYNSNYQFSFLMPSLQASGTGMFSAYFGSNQNASTFDSGGIYVETAGSTRVGLQVVNIGGTNRYASIQLGASASNTRFEVGVDIPKANTQSFSIYDVSALAYRMHIDSSGNVMFGGITSTTEEMELRKDQNAATRFMVSNSSTGTSGRSGIFVGDGSSGTSGVFERFSTGFTGDTTLQGDSMVYASGSGGMLHFGTEGVKRVTILNNAAKVGIGVDPPVAELQVNGAMAIIDGMTAPSTITGYAVIYVDTADGDLKVKFGDGTVKTIVVDT